MPDTLNKQALVNLLIDSPLREPIKINLIDIVNNTNEPDLPKVYSTITKELEIFQKATERRMKLAEETIAKLGGTTAPATPNQVGSPQANDNLAPPLDLPPLPTPPATPLTSTPPLSVPPLDLPPMPASTSASLGGPVPTNQAGPAQQDNSLASALQPLGAPAKSSTTDEDALAEIQKELDSLKTETATEISTTTTPTASPAVAPSEGVAPTPQI